MRFGIWRFAVAPSDAAEKTAVALRYLKTTIFHVHNSSKDDLENLLTVWLLVRSRFWTTYTNFDNWCQRFIATSGKIFFYRCTSTFSALNYCGEILFKSLSCLYEGWAQSFPPIFVFFVILDRNFANVVAPSSNENENCVAPPKARSILKKKLKTVSINRAAIILRAIHPVERTACGIGGWEKKQTPHFRTYSRRALFHLPKRWIVVALVVHILKGVNNFSVQFIVLRRGHNVDVSLQSKNNTGRLRLCGTGL